MSDILNEHFASAGAELTQDVSGELQSILRLHSITAQELFYKWESYSLKMGADNVTMDLKTARDFKKDLQEVLERETRAKFARSADKRAVGATPRNQRSGNDVFDMMDGVMQNTPRAPMVGVNGNSAKRRNDFTTPASKSAKANTGSSPSGPKPINHTSHLNLAFADRPNAGHIEETLNAHIPLASSPTAPFNEQRIKLKANTDLSKLNYKPMAMKLSQASEILDDRIDEFVELVQAHHNLEDGAFGNPASQSPSEIIAVGRIASDLGESKLNSASIVLETSRRNGAGLRVPLKLEALPSYDLFPGKIVALRGSNASGEYFTVSEMLDIPLLPQAASKVSEIETINSRLGDSAENSSSPLNIIFSSGPYTADSNLDFEPFQALCDRATQTVADAIILIGPFLDVEHPMLASGDFPSLPSLNPDTATLTDVFKVLISAPLQRLAQAVPSLTIILVPSVRDAVHKHVSWPQDRMARKDLSLPKQSIIVSNPVTLSLNEVVVAISAEDVLSELRMEECIGGTLPQERQGLLARLPRHLIEQRHFFPLFPPASRDKLVKPSAIEAAGDSFERPQATGAMLDLSYLALGAWQMVRPDILVTPSVLAPFAKVAESVLVINPGTLSKKKGPGTFAQMQLGVRKINEEERQADEFVGHRAFERARVDVIKI